MTKEIKEVELVLSPDKPVPITGNFVDYEKMLSDKLKQFDGVKVTGDNALSIKKDMQPIRTKLEAIKKKALEIYVKATKVELESKFDKLLDMVAQIESKADVVIDAETKKRNEKLTKQFEAYIAKKAKELGLPADVAVFITLDKQYYNKTQREGDTLKDLDHKLMDAKVNFEAYNKAGVLLNNLKKEFGAIFDYNRFESQLSCYENGNERVMVNAMEEAERLRNAGKDTKSLTGNIKSMTGSSFTTEPIVTIDVELKVVKKAKDYRRYDYSFDIPVEIEKDVLEVIKQLKKAGVKDSK